MYACTASTLGLRHGWSNRLLFSSFRPLSVAVAIACTSHTIPRPCALPWEIDEARSLGNLVFDLPNSREMESEADYIGMQLMAKACFDPHEMPKTFGRMKAEAKKRGVSKGSAYLSTHPADDERIAKQEEWMDSAVQTRQQSGCPDLAQWGMG